MDSNPFRPVKRESYEQQLDLSAPPPTAKLIDETDELVDVGLSSSQATGASAVQDQPKFLETSSSSLLTAGGPIGPNGAMGSASGTAASNGMQQTAQGGSTGSSLFARTCGWFSVEYYQPYFDVSTATVIDRMKNGVSPHKSDLFGSTADSPPDLYGAIWISFTLVFLIGASSNLNSYLAQSSSKEPWEADYKQLTFASTMVFVYTFVVPIIIWAASLYVGVDPRPSLVKMISIYGYTIVVFIPSSLLCVIPSAAVQWIVVLLAGGVSGVVLVRNLYTLFGTYSALSQTDAESQTPLSTESPRSRTSFMLISGAAFLHFAFSLLLKLFFFQGADLASTMNGSTNTDGDAAGGK